MAAQAVEGVGLYVHIPFCASKCAYCDFPSYPGKLALRGQYIDAVEKEIVCRAPQHQEMVAQTVYIGGGTPSLLAPEQIARILAGLRRHYTLVADAEISCEANPGMVSAAFLQAFVQSGGNRLSIGAQSADAQQLKQLGRRHRWADVQAACQLARSCGITNLNVDLMAGLPGQSMDVFLQTLQAALALDTPHISCYGLIVEEGTALQRLIQAGRLSLPQADAAADILDQAALVLAQHGYRRYEVSNFAKPGYECRHNLACWRRQPYIGFGAAAHSLEGKYLRCANVPTIEGYLAGEPRQCQQVSPQEAMFESVMLGLRMTDGVDDVQFQHMHGTSFQQAFALPVQRNLQAGLARWQGSHFCATARGMDVLNRVLVDFMP